VKTAEERAPGAAANTRSSPSPLPGRTLRCPSVSARPSHYLIFLGGLLVFKLLYIPCEIALNSVLASTYAAAANAAHMHAVELLGRSLSGIAAAVLVLRLGLRGRLPSSRAGWVGLIAVVATVSFAVIFGQKAAVNAIAAGAPADMRRDAVLLRTLPAALGANRTAIAGFTIDDHGGARRTLLALAPAIEFFDAGESRQIESHLDQVLFGPAMTTAIAGDTDPAWSEFGRFAADYHATYDRYLAASRDLSTVAFRADVLADETYAGIHTTANVERARYVAATSENGVRQLHSTLDDYYRERWWHVFALWPSSTERAYNDEMQTLFAQRVDPSTWCDWWKCPGSIDFVRARLTDRLVQSSLGRTRIDPSHGYDLDSVELAAVARSALDPIGATLPDNWRLTDRIAFVRAAEQALRAKTLQRVAEVTQPQLCGSVPPSLAFISFTLNSDVQAGIRCDLTRRFGVAPPSLVYPDWTRAMFERHFLTPAIALAQDGKASFLGPVGDYRDGGPLADRGREAIVAILVPVVSLALSLFLGIWNLVSAGTLLVTLYDRARERPMQITTWLAGGAIAVVPFILPIGLAASPGFRPAIASAAQHSRAAAEMLNWVGRAEPGVLEFANADRDVVRRIVGSEPMAVARHAYPMLAAADCALIQECIGPASPRR
jgi:hypothetical protein